MIRLARNMTYFYIDFTSAIIAESWREIRGAMRSPAVARSRR